MRVLPETSTAPREGRCAGPLRLIGDATRRWGTAGGWGTDGTPGDAVLGRGALLGYALGGLAAGLAVVAGAMAGGTVFVSHLPGAWFFGVPGRSLGWIADGAARTRAVAVLAVYGGVSALAVVWWRLVRALHHRPGNPVGHVAAVLATWAAPFVVGPPLFSRDLYSYAAQGEMVSRHIDPYRYGTGVLGATHFTVLAGPFWGNTPSPYGPTFLSLDGLATRLAGHAVLPDIVLLRLLAVVGVGLVVAGLPTLARRAGVDPATAVALGAGSPLLLVTLVGGGHNDALMIGLLVAGLAAWVRVGPIPGIVLCALATGVKEPAALGIVLIGWNWAGPRASSRRRVAHTAGAFAIAGATLELTSLATGVGWGWLRTVGAPTAVHSATTPMVAVADLVDAVAHLVRLPLPQSAAVTALSVAGLAAAAGVGAWLLWHSPAVGPLLALGLTLLVLALLSPVLWGWYLTWGTAVLAAAASGLLRRVLVWLSVGEVVLGILPPLTLLRTLDRGGPVAVLLVACGVAATILLAAGPTRGRAAARPDAARVERVAGDPGGWTAVP